MKSSFIGEIPLKELELSVRSLHALQRYGIEKIKDLLKFKTTGDLLRLRNLGRYFAIEVMEKAAQYGIIIEESNRVTIKVEYFSIS